MTTNFKLILDLGNTLCKVAVFEQDTLVELEKCNLSELIKTIQETEKNYEIQQTIVSSVVKLSENIADFLSKRSNLILLSRDAKLNFKNLYESKHTLGIDRIALVAAASYQYPSKNVLIIDAGTCITYDFKTNNNEYLGGGISPGLQMRYNSLHDYTANLPKLEKDDHFLQTGKDTKTSIHSGVINGVIYEIDGVINNYKNKYLDLTVVLTGGDTNFLSKQLKNSIFAHQNFLLQGLNAILTLNTNE